MALPMRPSTGITSNLDFPTGLFGSRSTDVELYEQDDAFVLAIELPGFDLDDIEVNWFEGRLSIAAEREDETRGRRRTYHRTFRFPKAIEPDDIEATYRNGVLEVSLPIQADQQPSGREIEVTG